MNFIFWFIVFAFLISGILLPWLNRSNINYLKKEVKKLKDNVKFLLSIIEKEGIDTSAIKVESNQNNIYKRAEIDQETIIEESDIDDDLERDEFDSEAIKTVDVLANNSGDNSTQDSKSKVSFEQQFGARLPVWIGGIALALAGFFLIKYSIENSLLSPTVRVILGAIFGIGLLYSSKWVRSKPDFANGIRIAQSLAGSGIAVLYVVFFASARLYEIISVFTGFVSMAFVTTLALILSLRYGMPIALMGMAGGFLTPALLSMGEGNIFTLFIYLYFTASGLLIVIRKTQWWWLSIPTIITSLIWVIVWLIESYNPGDGIWLGIFLTAISATIVISSKQKYEEDRNKSKNGVFQLTSILNYLGLGGSLVMMGIIVRTTGFGLMEWGLFGFLALFGIGLAYFNDKLYGFIPWICMAVNAVTLFFWNSNNDVLFATTLTIFAFIYIGSSYFLAHRSKSPILWIGLGSITSIFYYLLAYFELRETILFANIPLFWGVIALILAAITISTIFKVYEYFAKYEYKDHIYAILIVVATTFISLALSIELDKEFLSVAFATELLVISWINSKVFIKVLRPVAAILAVIFALLILPQIILMLQLVFYSLFEFKIRIQSTVPIVQWPLFQLGIPAIMFLTSSYMLKKEKDDNLVKIFEVTTITLTAIMGYYFTRNAIHPDQNVLFIKAGFFERGIITNIAFIYGLICLYLGRRFNRIIVSYSGIALCAAAILRIIYFDIIIHNPIWDAQQSIKGVAILNTMLITYGIPLIWSYLAKKELIILNKQELTRYLGGFMLISLFVLISLNVRYIFQGEYLHIGITNNAEIYSYSVVWLIFGIGLLLGGTIKKDRVLRYASLGVILFTVGKVFLYDASELEGLYRVFSFFGLGVTLIGLSYFYTRFVFKENDKSN